MTHRTLTPGQLRYVQFRVAGDRPQQAYAKAFPGASRAALACKPYLLEKNARVKMAISAANANDVVRAVAVAGAKGSADLLAAGAVNREVAEVGMTRAEKRKILKKIANDTRASKVDRIRAIQVDNLMTGDNKPVRFEGEITLNGIFQALKATTGLPDAGELIELDPNGPMALEP